MIRHEEIVARRGRRTGATVIMAVHSTVLGPAIGGCRVRRYPSWQAGLEDAARLSEAMTWKASIAGLDHGGGKTVVVLPTDPVSRDDLLEDVATVLESFGGRYLTGPDIGTGPDDMQSLFDRTGFAFCRPVATGGSGDSGPATADGVLAALLAGVAHVFGVAEVAGLRIGIIGLGSVGLRLAESLRAASLVVADIDESRRADASRLGAQWTSPEALLKTELDVLVPAAVGGLLTPAVAAEVSARLIVGPANNQLAADAVADQLHHRGITWIPDYLASAGGVIHAIGIERHGLTPQTVNPLVQSIGTTVSQVLTEAATTGRTPLAITNARAMARVTRG
ncbi:Glu/Leu/Phe/Val dehydrogenase dimerization domain-containing protein [Kribbella sp. NPDC023972]|uniref:Glu/Leu/Phe/Val dehydrogenase dimerization domain-containing protein n=1 Tax=Kribbella sp. NPDC023972 TaxID=3154795 RepID=UPI0033C764BD